MNHPEKTEAASGFQGFGLHASLKRGLAEAGFVEPRPIQAETIPAAVEGRDVMGLAQTGTGKTAAFALPIIDRCIRNQARGPRALILAPTRELAMQIEAEIRLLAKFTRVRSVTLFGGRSVQVQAQALRKKPEIVVGCPGRVLDMLKQGELDLTRVETLVLDEADHMFDMGFLPDVKRILSALPEERQNLLFSATMPREIRQLADRILLKPCVVELAHSAPAERIEHVLCPVDPDRKRDLLDRLLSAEECETAIVFTRTKHRARQLAKKLEKQGLRAVALQGNMSQAQRDRAMGGFRERRFDVLVATDIAARGLDVAGVSYVINVDPPSTPELYTHRIGRTGRSELSGKAWTLVTTEDRDWIRDTERFLGAGIPRAEFDGFGTAEIDSSGGTSRPAQRSRSNPRSPYGANESRPGRPSKRKRSRGRKSGPGSRSKAHADRHSGQRRR